MPPLSSLRLPSLTQQVLSYLSDLGIVSVEDFLVHDTYQLISLVGYQKDSNQYKQAVADILLYLEENHAVWWNGVDLLKMNQQIISIIPIGCKSLDTLLQGGLREGTMTELVGVSASGKTQVCIQAASTTLCLGGSVAYIDTGNSFSAVRLLDMLQGLRTLEISKSSRSLEQSLKALVCYKIHDIFSLLDLLHQIDASFVTCMEEKESTSPFQNLRLLILDSVTSVVAPALANNHVQGHALMMQCGHTLRKIAVDNNLCVMVTNHMVMGENSSFKPALGESWKTVANVCLFLAKDPANSICCASLMKHSSMRCNKRSFFRLVKAGLESVDVPE